MFTQTGTFHLLKHVSRAHRCFMLPLIRQAKKKREWIISVDNSWRYKRGALGILLLDVVSFVVAVGCSWTTLVWKNEFDLSVRLLGIFLCAPLLLNVFFDVYSMLRKGELEALLNFGQKFYYSATGKEE